MVEATTEDALAAVDLLHVTGADGPPRDPFDARDLDYIRATLPALRAMSQVYFRADVSGLDRIPPSGPVLLVGNHSGGTMIADTFVFAQAFYDHFGPERRFNQLAHDLVFKTPGLRTLVQRYGTVPASPENMARALDEDAALLVYPGGDEDSFRPSWETGDVELRRQDRVREARPRARRPDRPRRRARRPGDGPLPRTRQTARAGPATEPPRTTQGPAGRARTAVRGHRARLPRPDPAPVEDHDQGHAADRPTQEARPQTRTSKRATGS